MYGVPLEADPSITVGSNEWPVPRIRMKSGFCGQTARCRVLCNLVNKALADDPQLAEADVLPNDAYRIWMLLKHAADGMSRARENEVKPYGISRVQAGVMFVLSASKEPCTLSEISRWVFREPHTVSEMVARMERMGLVKRIRTRGKKAPVGVALTQKGREVFRKQGENRGVIERIVYSLSAEERDNLKTYLEILREKSLEELTLRPRLPAL